MWHPPTCITEEWKGLTACNCCGSLLRVSVRASICQDNSLFWAKVASWVVSSRRLIFVGAYVRSQRMAWSLAAMFSMSSIASSGVFSLIFPPTDASSNYFDCGRKPSMKMSSCTDSLYPCVGIFLSSLCKRSSISLRDSSGNWWNEEIFIFPSMVFDSGKYFFKNFSTTSSHVRRLFPLNERSHIFALSAKEKENRLRRMTSSGTSTIFIVLQMSMYVARCAYGSSLGRPWNRFPWIRWIKEYGYEKLAACTSGLAMLVKY